MESILMIIVFIIVSLWIFIIHLDKRSIRLFLESRGNTVVSVKWKIIDNDSFGKYSNPGIGKKIYVVRYRDPQKNMWLVFCEINILSEMIWGEEMYLGTGCKK